VTASVGTGIWNHLALTTFFKGRKGYRKRQTEQFTENLSSWKRVCKEILWAGPTALLTSPLFTLFRVMKRPLPLILSGYIAGVYAGSFLPFSYPGLVAGILAGAWSFCVPGKPQGAGASLSPSDLCPFGLALRGITVHPGTPSQPT